MFPEGPVFDRKGNLYVMNLQGGCISKIKPNGKVSKFVETGGAPNGATISKNDYLIIADCKLKSILNIVPSGKIQVITSQYQGREFLGPNDVIFGPHGNLYFTDPTGSSLKDRIGAVYCHTKQGEVFLLSEGFAYPNGIVVPSDGKTIFVAETFTGDIHQIFLNGDGTASTERKIWVKLGEDA